MSEGQKNHLGTLTMISKIEYYDLPCNSKAPHPRHLLAAGGGGAGSRANGPYHGEQTLELGTSYECWCPGIPGIVQM